MIKPRPALVGHAREASFSGCKSGPPLEAYAGDSFGSCRRVAWARGGVSGLDAVSRSAGSVLLGVNSYDANNFCVLGCKNFL
jgi:hypothetical protein